MPRANSLTLSLLIVLYFGAAAAARADVITLNAVDSGWYTRVGEHEGDNENYVAGRPFDEEFEYRNFFVFDLARVAPDSITGATLRLFNPSGDGYQSLDPTEAYTVFDVLTAVPVLRETRFGGPEGLGIFADLGAGAVYGSVTVSAADNGTVVTFSLNETALSALNRSRGLFALGGAVTTLRPDELNLVERIFGDTGEPGDVRQLVLEAEPVPEPATMLLLGTGLLAGFGTATSRRRERRDRKN